MPKTCFVIGPIGELGSDIRAHADDVLKYIIEPCEALKKFDYEKPVRADLLPDPGRITPQIIEWLLNADLVIADLTFNNPNVYYELSLRHALSKPAIHLCHDGTKLSFDIFDTRTIFFTLHSRRVETAKEDLQRQITRTHEADYKVRNPIVDTLGQIKLEQSSQPLERHMADIIRSIERLNAEIQTIKARITTPTQSGAGLLAAPSVIFDAAGGAYVSFGGGNPRYSREGAIYSSTNDAGWLVAQTPDTADFPIGPAATPIVLRARANADQPPPPSQSASPAPSVGPASEKPK